MSVRFARNEALFGAVGQDLLRATGVAVVGNGGLGTHVVQQLTLLGVGELSPIDDEVLDETNLNRYVGVGPDDVGKRKVDLAERLARGINPAVIVNPTHASLISVQAFDVIKRATWVVGCVDNDGARLVLTELCSAYEKPLIDLATDVLSGSPPTYGGRICVVRGDGCPVCLDLLDMDAARTDLESPEARKDRAAIYGVDRQLLGAHGPAVVSLNGVVASLAVTELMVTVTGLREPIRLLNYHGNRGVVSASRDAPAPDCYYCRGIRGRRQEAGVERYLSG